MSKFFILSLLLLLTTLHTTFSQRVKLDNDIPWYDGTILFKDGSRLQGLVHYNHKIGVLSFQDIDETDTFTPRTVLEFTFYDSAKSLTRTYLSLIAYNRETKINGEYFFEVLKQLKKFALVSLIDPIGIAQKNTGGSYSPTFGYSPGAAQEYMYQNETLYIVDDQGKSDPYLRIMARSDRKKTNNKLIKEEALLLKLVPYYKQLVQFASERKLSFSKKDDLLVILDEYEQLILGEE